MAAIVAVCFAFFSSQRWCSSEFVAVVFVDSLSLLHLEMYYFGWQSTECQYSQEDSSKGKQVFILLLPVE